MNKEEIEEFYNEKIIAKENINKEELIYNIVSVFTTMNNFEDWLCDDMQDKIANIKQYIEQLENKVKETTKGNNSLMQSRKKWKSRYYKKKNKVKEKDREIRELIRYKENCYDMTVKEQDLIKMLKEDIKQSNEIINESNYRYIQEVIDDAYIKRSYAIEILSKLKGEK